MPNEGPNHVMYKNNHMVWMNGHLLWNDVDSSLPTVSEYTDTFNWAISTFNVSEYTDEGINWVLGLTAVSEYTDEGISWDLT